MIGKGRAFALGWGAMLVFGGIFCGSAVGAEFHSENAHTRLVGGDTTNVEFVTPSGTIRCTDYNLEGTAETATAMDLTLTFGSFFGCVMENMYGLTNPTRQNAGCYWKLTTATEPLHILCGTGAQILFQVAGCTIAISPQTTGSASYTNTGSGKTRAIDISFNLSSLKGTATGFLCIAPGEFTNGTFTGTVNLRTLNTASEQVGLWYE